jgi:ribosomal protein S18 acetylase RimI-like enzyme
MMEDIYQLSDNFSLKRCEIEKFATNWAVYSQFSTWDEYQIRKNELLNPKARDDIKDNCYWILKQNTRIGGLILKPNELAFLFFEPPFLDYNSAIRAISKLLQNISNLEKTTYAYRISLEFVDHFLRCGYYPNETRLRMIRTTEKFHIEWSEDLVVKVPEKQNIEQMAKIYLDAYAGSREEWLRLQESPNAEKKDIEKIKKEYEELIFPKEEEKKENLEFKYIPDASIAIFSKAADGKQELMGCCLISLWNNTIPLVYDIFISPAHQGRGLGTKMLKHALTNLADSYEFLQLFTIKGNTAESVYYNLGFKILEEIPLLIVPANKKL